MCSKKSPPPPPPGHGDHEQSSSMINNTVKEEEKDHEDEEEEEELTLEAIKRAARKSRTKTRKPKFLSLRSQQLISHSQDHEKQDRDNYRVPSTPSNTSNKTFMAAKKASHRHQLNLFPLHPENQLVDHQDDNVALLFHSDGSATLNGLLNSTTATTSTTMSSDLEEESFSTFAYGSGAQEYYRPEEGHNDILRTAMRSREREMSVEKWVSYSELVDKKEEVVMEDCSTSTTTHTDDDQIHQWWGSCKVNGAGFLALKLDYQEILNAWSDKGPLYIDDGDSPQTVPDLLKHQQQQDHQLFQLHDNTPNGCAGNLWTVPEQEDGSLKMKTEQREASVLRYKEKRQSRLFSKRIRYQVRKLNAEKRPRMKGRFVKRS